MTGGTNIRRWDGETALVAWFAACISILSFLFYFRQGQILLYGDAVAHINIARRVFDSRTPGPLQLGTVWLPLPHLSMIPFLLSDWAWQSGVGGSIPSMLAYVLGAVGLFRLLRGAVKPSSPIDVPARLIPWAGALIYAANPNLIYLQTTAMTEPLYLALFIWVVVHFSEFSRHCESADAQAFAASSLNKCGLCLLGACITRYDGWILGAATCGAAMWALLKTGQHSKDLKIGLRNLLLLASAGPTLWLGYNAVIYRNPLEFANGPYSAKAIEEKTSVAGMPLHPGARNLTAAASYFLKSAELTLASGNWGRVWVLFVLAGSVLVFVLRPGTMPLLLLWTPMLFYALSVAYGSVPIFIPVWWPFSCYNTRYGVELLPAFAAFVPVAVYFAAKRIGSVKAKIAIAAVFALFVIASYATIWHDPLCFREAWINSRTRLALEKEVAAYMQALPPRSTLLMYLGDHVGALQQAGIPLRRVINEGNHRVWMQPQDSEGLWERALANPERYADFVIGFDQDPVSKAVARDQLVSLAVIHVSGQPQATIYQTKSRH
jgi:hypothetical protein